MKMTVRKYYLAQVALLCLWPILLHAQSSDRAQNLADCRNGLGTCDRSQLSESELADATLAAHLRNVTDCRTGFDACDHSKLSEPEAIALAVAQHQKNVSNCMIGLGYRTTTVPPLNDFNSTIADYR